MVEVWPTVRVNTDIFLPANPGAVASTVYRPGRRLRNTYAPALFVTVVFSTDVSTLRRRTVAFGITAPPVSLTTPFTEALDTWEKLCLGDHRISANRRRTAGKYLNLKLLRKPTNFFISPLR
jgi:hypothetical protein